MLFCSLGIGIGFLSFCHRGHHVQLVPVVPSYLPKARVVPRFQHRAHTVISSFSCTKERFLSFCLHYKVIGNARWILVSTLITISFISLQFPTFSFFTVLLLLFCSSWLLDLIFLFISTFSCKLFSLASIFTYRKKHYLPPGNFNACLKRTAFWKDQQKEKHRWRVGLREGKRTLFSGFFVFVATCLPYQNIPLGQLKAAGHPN